MSPYANLKVAHGVELLIDHLEWFYNNKINRKLIRVSTAKNA